MSQVAWSEVVCGRRIDIKERNAVQGLHNKQVAALGVEEINADNIVENTLVHAGVSHSLSDNILYPMLHTRYNDAARISELRVYQHIQIGGTSKSVYN